MYCAAKEHVNSKRKRKHVFIQGSGHIPIAKNKVIECLRNEHMNKLCYILTPQCYYMWQVSEVITQIYGKTYKTM